MHFDVRGFREYSVVTEHEPTTILALTDAAKPAVMPEWITTVTQAGHRLVPLSSASEVIRTAQPTPLVVTTADAGWRELIAGVQQWCPDPPFVLVLADRQDGSLLADVLQSGGFDVLFPPFEPEALLRDIRIARERWSRARVRRASQNGRSPHTGADQIASFQAKA